MAKTGKNRNKGSYVTSAGVKRYLWNAGSSRNVVKHSSAVVGKSFIIKDQDVAICRDFIQRHSNSIEYLLEVEKDGLESMVREIQMLKSGKLK